ncbi:Fatty-acid amide hydrolase 1, partial [Eschrichtius robustus]|nr:Fatty-acid amide hydrolase 1 [Eschrichtius robustus]
MGAPNRCYARASEGAQGNRVLLPLRLAHGWRRETMVLDELWDALSGPSGATLACFLVAAALALHWSSHRTARGAAARARQRQQAALETMDKAAQRFRLQVYTSSQPLRVGYYETDNYTMPTPAMTRALLETKKRLEAAGHTLVPFLPSNIPHALETLSTGGLFSDGGKSFLQNFKGDFVDPCLGDLISILRLPRWLKGLLAFMLRPL